VRLAQGNKTERKTCAELLTTRVKSLVPAVLKRSDTAGSSVERKLRCLHLRMNASRIARPSMEAQARQSARTVKMPAKNSNRENAVYGLITQTVRSQLENVEERVRRGSQDSVDMEFCRHIRHRRQEFA
jgi:hypothetical protein